MRCSKCGFDNPADSKLCSNCGAELEATAQPPTSTAFCPQCGSPLSSEAQFCSKCGAKLVSVCPKCGSEVTTGTRFCRQCGQDLSGGVIKQAAPVAPGKRAFPLANIIAAGVGGIMMLVSLAVPWYTIRLEVLQHTISRNVSASDLLHQSLWPLRLQQPDYAGSALPLVLLITFASIVLLSVAYSLWSQRATRALWAWLGSLSALCVIANAVYILWWLHDRTDQWVNLVQAGSIVAFVGALVVAFSSIGSKRTTVG
jgi:ribosomal protein L40E